MQEALWAARSKWRNIGTRLNVGVSDLECINAETGLNIAEKFDLMLQTRLKMENCTWKDIYDALKHPTVGMPHVAKNILPFLPKYVVESEVRGVTKTPDVENSTPPETTEVNQEEIDVMSKCMDVLQKGYIDLCVVVTEELSGGVTVKKLCFSLPFKANSKIHMVLAMRGSSCPTNFIDDSLLDPDYDYDFTDKNDSSTKFYRGGKRYYRPYGWYRIALKVIGKYSDDGWLGKPGYRTNSSPGEWAVSYHATSAQNCRNIAQEGYDLSKGIRLKCSHGVCTSPSIDAAAQYAKEFIHEGKTYQLVFQNRVSVKGLRVIDTPQGEYWFQPDDQLIRPYGICVQKL